MRKVIFIAVVMCLIVQAKAQKRTRDFLLIPPNGTVESSLYRTIEVIDDREFKGNLGVIQVGAFNSKAQVIPEIPLEDQIQQQLDLLVSGDKGNGILVLLIHRFAVAELTGAFSESGFFDFRADLFVKYEDQSYQKLATIDTAHVNKGMDVSKALLRHASHIVTDFLINNLNSLPVDIERYSKTQLLDMEVIQKRQIPLYSINTLKDGLYLDYSHFRDQLPQGDVSFKDGDFTKGVYVLDAQRKLKRMKSTKCYAVVVNGKAYISSENNLYELYKKDNDFFFDGISKVSPSASNVIAVSVMFGALGAVLASNSAEYYVNKIDFYNGNFIKVSKL